MKDARWILLKQHWLHVIICFFCLVTITVNSHQDLFAQTPTPDVNTVPRLEDLITPTPTSTLAPVPVITATPIPVATEPVDTSIPADETQPEERAQERDSGALDPNEDAVGPQTALPGLTEPSGSGADGQANQRTALVTTDLLNVRSAPNTTSTVIDQLAANNQVTLLEKAEDAAWWYICCGTVNNRQGWVSSQYLVILADPLSIEAEATTAQDLAESVATVQEPLLITLTPLQRFVWQGQQLTVKFLITNPRSTSVRQLNVRTDLPADVNVLTTSSNLSGVTRMEEQATGRTIIQISWPEIAPGTQAVATLDLQVAAEATNGTFFDIIAAVDAAGEETVATGLTISMPPNQLPSFR